MASVTKKLFLENQCDDGTQISVEVELPFDKIRDVPSNLTAGKVWPASIVLSHFLLHHKSFLKGKKIFEFGSGIAIPSLSCLKSGNINGVFLQELDISALLKMQQAIFSANNIETQEPVFCQVPLKWGAMPEEFVERYSNEIGLFIAADCLYEKNDFADLVATVAFLLNKNRNVPFVMCYQDRNLLYSIDELLEFWGLKSELIPISSFVFDPVKFVSQNDPSICDDFPIDRVEQVLVMLEICRVEDDYKFVMKH